VLALKALLFTTPVLPTDIFAALLKELLETTTLSAVTVSVKVAEKDCRARLPVFTTFTETLLPPVVVL